MSDTAVHAEPALPTIGAAGTTFLDPTYRTPILRVTDDSNQPSNDANIRGANVTYPYVSALNCNSTRLCLITVPSAAKRATIYSFNPTAFTCGSSGTLLASALSNNVQEFWMLWDSQDPDKLYALANSGYGIYETNVNTDSTTLVKALTGLGHTGGSCQQLSVSEDNDVFAWCFATAGGSYDGWGVYRRSTDTMLKVVTGLTPGDLNEVQIDKSGRYIAAVFADDTCEAWDLNGTPTKTGDRTQLENAVTGYSWSHYDTGYGTIFTRYWAIAVVRNIGIRNLATPTVLTPLLNDGDIQPGASNQSEHYSLRSNVDADAWGALSRFSLNGSSVVAAYDNEIFLVATDGSRRVRRICHHRSKYTGDYYDSPFANQSRDGRFIVFQSNLGTAGGRHDVFVVKVDL